MIIYPKRETYYPKLPLHEVGKGLILLLTSKKEECGAPTSTGASFRVACFPMNLILKPAA